MHQFRLCVNTYHGNYRMRSFSCLDQFLCMAFAQLSYREGPGDIESCSRAMQNKLYHIGIKARVSKSTLAYAHENRDWRIYTDFAQALNSIAQDLYANEDFVVELDETVLACIDAAVVYVGELLRAHRKRLPHVRTLATARFGQLGVMVYWCGSKVRAISAACLCGTTSPHRTHRT